MSDSRVLTGIGVSPGIAIGPALVLHWALPNVPASAVAPEDVEGEIVRLRSAVESVRTGLEELRARAVDRVGPAESKIFDAQILMLEDVDFLGGVERLIRANQLSAAQAFEFKALELRALWSQSSSSLLRERRADLFGVQVRVLHELVGEPLVEGFETAAGRPAIVFTRELTPGLTVQFEPDLVAGFVSEAGTRTSHAAILAHSLGIPCVMGLGGGLQQIRAGVEVIVDGTHGTVCLDPTKADVKEAKVQDRRRRALVRELNKNLGRPAVTVDGERVSLQGNVDVPEELEQAVLHAAEGVGLLRTEFLLVGRTELPSEEEQTTYFKRVAGRFEDHPVIIRSYDLGGDKFPAPFRPPSEPNPFLGWRAIRVCLDEPEVFRTQIRAVLQARVAGDVKLMLPLVTSVEEVERTRELVEQCAAELASEGKEAAGSVPVGVMIETPAAAIIADQLLTRSDFVSVGSNDLTQYMLAVDRGNVRLADRFTAFHPAVVRVLKEISDVTAAAGMSASVCGEMASEPIAAFLLLGLGYRVLSVSPPALPLIRWVLRQIDIDAATRAAADALAVGTTGEVNRILQEGIAECVDLRWLEAGRLPRSRRVTSFKA